MTKHQNQQYAVVNNEPPVRNKHSIIRKKSGIQCFGLITVILLIGCILGIILHHVNSGASRTSESLRFVIAVTRHGARAPINIYPHDPYSNLTEFWPEGFGGLTKIGKQQMYKLGQMLRNIYDGFLSEHYMPKEFIAQSTMEERTYMSAATLLAGLYPPKTYQIWNPAIDWQPIPIYSTNLDKYNMPLKPYLCPAYWKELNYSLDSNSVKRTYQELFKILAMHTGTDDSYLHMMFVWDTLTCEYWNDMELPEWTRGIYPDKMIEPATAIYDIVSVNTQTMTRLFIGPLLKLIVQHISDKVNGTLEPDRKMFYHSGHDLTLLGLQKVLGINDIGIVNPASSLLLELHYSEENKYYIKMVLVKGTKSTPEPIATEIPICESPCDVENFILGLNKYLVTDWNRECEL